MEKEINQKEVEKILKQAKKLAKDYYDLTKKPLGITGEVAEVSAANELKLELSDDARQPGYDAIRKEKDGKEIKIQIKGRCVPKGKKSAGVMPIIKLEGEAGKWDTLVLVILDEKFEVRSMYEANKAEVRKALQEEPISNTRKRGVLTVSRFKSISEQVWPKRDA